MSHFNFSQLQYFWEVAERGSIQAAAKRLRVVHSNVSTQVRALQHTLGAELFERSGRGLRLTPAGEHIKAIADDVVRLRAELEEFAKTQAQAARRTPFRLGMVAVIPKTVLYHFVEPTLRTPELGPLSITEDTLANLMAGLATGRLHVVLSDQAPKPVPGLSIHAHSLGTTGVTLFGRRALVKKLKSAFPSNLNGAPMLLPLPGSSLRRQLDRWFIENDVRPLVVGEFTDSAALRSFGSFGEGLFPVRTALSHELDPSNVEALGPCEGVREHYFALSVERRIRHPGVAALVTHIRRSLKSSGLTPAPQQRE